MIAAANPIAPAQSAPVALRLDGRRKLIPLPFFMVLFGLSDKESVDLIDDRIISPCFNLATRTDGRRKIHLWRGVIEAYQPGSRQKFDLQTVIAATLPMLGILSPATATIRGVELTRRWCLAHETVACLIRAGELREIGKHDVANESPRIAYASAAQFLERRVL